MFIYLERTLVIAKNWGATYAKKTCTCESEQSVPRHAHFIAV
jgi:hypothetical protein